MVLENISLGSNAPVSIADLKDERWWGKCSESAPLYNTDCYRVLPVDGKCNDDGFSSRLLYPYALDIL